LRHNLEVQKGQNWLIWSLKVPNGNPSKRPLAIFLRLIRSTVIRSTMMLALNSFSTISDSSCFFYHRFHLFCNVNGVRKKVNILVVLVGQF